MKYVIRLVKSKQKERTGILNYYWETVDEIRSYFYLNLKNI